MQFGKTTLALIVAAFAVQSTYGQSIYEIAAGNEAFSTLTAAIDVAGLTDALSGDGTFTVFAPPDTAFAALPDGVVTTLLEPDWLYHLQDLLLYHALGTEVLSSDLSDGLEAQTLNGENIVVNLDDPFPRINDMSRLLIDEGLIDIEADNGVIHGVEGVLLPTSVTSSIVDIAAGNPDFSTLVAAVQAADLVEALSGEGPFTVFAPTNAAFEALPEGTVETLLLPENIDALTDILVYHVVEGNAHSSTLSDGSVTTLNGDTVDISTDGGVTVNDANVVAADILANNGIIHVIDKVLLPPSEEVPEQLPEEVPEQLPEAGTEQLEEGEPECNGDSTVDIVLDISGAEGFDSNGNDFDILRDLVLLTGLDTQLGDTGMGGVSGITVFAPRDHAFFMLAKALSEFLDDGEYDSDSKYDEEAAFTYIAGVLTTVAEDILDTDLTTLVTNILLYHVANEEIVFTKLAESGADGTTVTTLYPDTAVNEIPIVMAMDTEFSNMRMKMLHNANTAYFKNPKIHNKQFDIETCNGRLNTIKRVLIPLKL